MVVVIGPLSGGHTHKTADRPIIPSSLTPPLSIVHRIFSLDRLPAVLLLPASKAARLLDRPGHRSPGQKPPQDDDSSTSSPGWRRALWCLLRDPLHFVTRYVCICRRMAGPKPRTLAASSARSRVTSARLRLRLRLRQSLQYLGVPSGSLTSSCIPYTALDLDAPRPSSNVPGAARVTRYRTSSRRPLVGLHCTATRPKTPAGCWPPLAASPGGGRLFALPRGFCPTGPKGRHAWQKDRSVRSQLRSSVACLTEYSNLVSSHLSASPGLCCSSAQCIISYSCARHIYYCYSKPCPAFTRSRRPF